MGRLEVRVCAARNVGNTHRIGKPDPYVKINVGTAKETKLKYKTRVIEKSLNPTWNELFKFQIADADSCQILFELWEEGTFKDDLLGTYSVNLNALKKGVVMDTWAILSGTKVSTTELRLRILAVDFGREPEKTDRLIKTLEADQMVSPTGQTARLARPEAGFNTSPQFPTGFHSGMPQGPPQPVHYGAGPYGAQPSPYGMGPPQPMFFPTPRPGPAYGYNSLPQNFPPYQQGPPPPPGPYGVGPYGGAMQRPPQLPVQYAVGIPPDM